MGQIIESQVAKQKKIGMHYCWQLRKEYLVRKR